jgi:hypothetical protein
MNSGKRIRLKVNGTRYAHGQTVRMPIGSMTPDFLVQFEVIVEDSTGVLPQPEDRKIRVAAHLERRVVAVSRSARSSGEVTFERIPRTEAHIEMELYRMPEAEDGGDAATVFERYKRVEVQAEGGTGEPQDHDFFVLPRANPDPAHEPYIRRLQFLSNQVIARNGRLEALDFQFLREDGLASPALLQNIRNSVEAFCNTESGAAHHNLMAVFPYRLQNNFGSAEGFLADMEYEYGIAAGRLNGIVLDRSFLYGEMEASANPPVSLDGVRMGLESLYEHVVLPFRTHFILHAKMHADFPHRWMRRPNATYNRQYHRGRLVVEGGMDDILVYDQETGISTVQVGSVPAGTPLPAGAVVRFAAGPDATIESDEHRYEVTSIEINDQSHSPETGRWFILLTLALKQACRDNENSVNFNDYVDLSSAAFQALDQRDREALARYGRQNGVPYFITEPGGRWGGKLAYDVFDRRLNVDVINWYSYRDGNETRDRSGQVPARPNSPTALEASPFRGVGLDCSGLIANCLLDITNTTHVVNSENGQPFFAPPSNVRRAAFERQAIDIGTYWTRLIPIDAANRNGDDLLVQAGDLIYSNTHIAICTIELLSENTHPYTDIPPNLDTHLTQTQREHEYFSIIHNPGRNAIRRHNGASWHNGCFTKTLEGPFRHWDATLNNTDTFVGRIYLWF